MSKAKRILTWHPDKTRGNGRWRKYVNGVVHYFGTAKSPNDLKAYRAAERKYLRFMEELETTRPVEIPASQATITDVSEKFLQHMEDRYHRDEISASHYDRLRGDLADFAAAVGPQKKMGCLGELDIEDYKSYTINRPQSNYTGRRISPKTAQGRLSSVRTFIRWAWKMHIMENLPRNLEDIAKVPNGGEPRVATFSLDELETLWDAALRRTRCWMALALNCGMGQKDITDLKVGEIDWAGGYIERTRSKTGVKTKHKLWGRTLELLAEFRNAGAAADDRFFLNENGLPLLRRWVEDGVFKHCDAIKNAFDRLLLKTRLNGGRGFYCLRKTGASLIETIDPAVTEMYLAHAEQGMKKHYAQRDWARLERALVEMEGRLGGVLTA